MVIKKTDFSPADGELMELKCIAVRILIFNLKMEAFEKGNINSGKISDN
jgi:hypothetical protein